MPTRRVSPCTPPVKLYSARMSLPAWMDAFFIASPLAWRYERVARPGFRAPSKGKRISPQSSADPITPLISRVPPP